MVTADSGPFVFAERITALLENIDTTATVAAPVVVARLSKVVEEGHDGNTVGREPDGMGEHMLIHFDGVLCKPSDLLVMAVTPPREIVRTAEVVNDGVRSRTFERADDVDNPLIQISIVLHGHTHKYDHCVKIFQASSFLVHGRRPSAIQLKVRMCGSLAKRLMDANPVATRSESERKISSSEAH